MTTKEQDLHKAVREDNIKEVESLIESGVNINAVYYGWTPLQVAIDGNRQSIAVYLIQKGCDVKPYDSRTKSPFEEALIKKQAQVVEALLTAGVNANDKMISGECPLCFAVESRSLELVKTLLNGGADVNCISKNSESTVYTASRDGQSEILKELLKKGSDVNQINVKNHDFTPLLVAVTNDQEEVTRILLKHNANVNTQDSLGWTALWHAYSDSNEELAKLLLQAGARFDIEDREGNTVLQDAKDNEDDDFVELCNKFMQV